MSQRSQVATSGSSPIAACSAACAAPGMSAAVDPGAGEHGLRHRPPDRLGAQGCARAGPAGARRGPRREGSRRRKDAPGGGRRRRRSTAPPAPTPRLLRLEPMSNVADRPGVRGPARVAAAHQGAASSRSSSVDHVGLPLVHVDGAGVDAAVGRGRVHGAEHPAGAGARRCAPAPRRRAARRWSAARSARGPEPPAPAGGAAARAATSGLEQRRRGRRRRRRASASVSGSSAAAAARCGAST